MLKTMAEISTLYSKMNHNQLEVLTPRGNGGISVIRFNGPHCHPFLSKHFITNSKSPLQPGVFQYGKIKNDKDLIDEILLIQQSENVFEIHCHGGQITTSQIIKLLQNENFHLIEKNKWDSSHLLQETFESITTQREFDFVKKQITLLAQTFKQISAYCDKEKLIILQNLLNEWSNEKQRRRRAVICFAGLPNAGKSSLLNQLTGKERSLVSDQEKTTRDTVTEKLMVNGYRLKLVDTAGLHQPDNALDLESIHQSKFHIQNAELVLWLHDQSKPFLADELKILNEIKNSLFQNSTLWLIQTKTDLAKNDNTPEDLIISHRISTKDQNSIQILLNHITNKLFLEDSDQASAINQNMADKIEDLIQSIDLTKDKNKIIEEFITDVSEALEIR